MKDNAIKLSDHFTFSKLIRFTLSPIVMMIFTSTYGVVDGFFVSNYAGATAFSALNLSMPFLMLLAAVGFSRCGKRVLCSDAGLLRPIQKDLWVLSESTSKTTQVF